MNKNKLLHELQKLFDGETRKKHKRINEIKKILKQLKDREHKLAEKLDKTADPEKLELLRQELDIIHAQRKKGINVLNELEVGEHK